MSQLQQFLGMSDQQMLQLNTLVSEMLVDNVVTDMLGALKPNEHAELAGIVNQGGDVQAAVSNWAQHRYTANPELIKAIEKSVQDTLDEIASQVLKTISDSQKHTLQTSLSA